MIPGQNRALWKPSIEPDVSRKAALADHAEQLLIELFGEPTKKRKSEWRWGRWGSPSSNFRRMLI